MFFSGLSMNEDIIHETRNTLKTFQGYRVRINVGFKCRYICACVFVCLHVCVCVNVC